LNKNFNKSTFVSVVVCTYNRAKYLEKCIESLKKQTYPHFEIIIVNGPSTDETSPFLERYPEIKLVNQDELNGLSFARNLGIKASNGEIIALIDDDAVADKDWIKYLVEGYTDESIGGVGGSVFDINGNRCGFKNGYISKAGIPSLINEKDLNYNDPNGNFFNYITGTNASFRKSVLHKIGSFDAYIKYNLDETDVCMRVILKSGHKIKHVNNAIVFHAIAEGHNRVPPYYINWIEIIKNIIYFTLKNFPNEFSSYTFRPAKSLLIWSKKGISLYINNQASLKQLFDIHLKLVHGAVRGYTDGLILNTKRLYKGNGK